MKSFVITLIIALMFVSCANKTEVRFIGKDLKSPCSFFIRHLENNGFHKDGESYEGKYMGKDVFIILGDTTKGYFDHILVTATFCELGEHNLATAKQYYKKVYRNIEKEHSGFEKEEEKDYRSESKEYFCENGGKVSVNLIGNEETDNILLCSFCTL